jgi:hypothetical protein
MNRRFYPSLVLTGLGLLLGAGALLAAAPAPPAASSVTQTNRPARESNPEAEIETLVRHAMPGEPHRLLDRLIGSWDTLTRYWPKPGVEAVESRGTGARRWILDGRFVLEELDGGNLALAFRGLGLFGFDAFAEKYTSAWVDTMNTSILTNLGAYNKTNDAVHFTGQYKDPWSGLAKAERGVLRFVGKDQHVLDIYVTEPSGPERKMLEITYTRRAAR